LNVSFFNLCF